MNHKALLKPSLWSLACPPLQPGSHGGMVPAHGTAASPAPCCKETTNSPPHHPSQNILKSKKKAFCITYLAEHLQTSSATGASHATQGVRTLDGGLITWPALYPHPRHRARFHVRSGHRSGRGDKGRPGSRRRSCAPSAGGHGRNPLEGTQSRTPQALSAGTT